VAPWRQLVKDLLGPFRVPRHPLSLARFGLSAILPATVLARLIFRHQSAQALLAGMSAHSMLPLFRAALLDLAPHRKQLARYRYGPGVFKVDWALEAAITWTADACRAAGTVHLGGTLAEVGAAERGVRTGQLAGRPCVILVQSSVVDSTRAPALRYAESQPLYLLVVDPAGGGVHGMCGVHAACAALRRLR
jgi:hypothetical protein